MGKRYYKMAKKANGKIREPKEGKVLLERTATSEPDLLRWSEGIDRPSSLKRQRQQGDTA